MSVNLLQKLKEWRRETAEKEGMPVFRVFPNDVLEAISEFMPSNKEALLSIKGIREIKYNKYGQDILALVNESKENLKSLSGKSAIIKRKSEGSSLGAENPNSVSQNSETDREKGNEIFNSQSSALSVSDYLDFLNEQLRSETARIQGEISSVDIRERVIYFSLKDSKDGSVINCLIWKNVYEMSGVAFEIGMEIIVEGSPDIFKSSGRLSFKASSAELVGEGSLKRAYDLLKKKLESEGIFAIERKRLIPELPQKIGLITSATGAVIHDFSTNLGRYGFQVKFIDSKVEGQGAVRDLISAIDYFENMDIDALVIIRGGGSMESLQAFNNEALVRKIAGFSRPVICGIGHEKDVPLASLAADKMVSTPTAAAHTLNQSWWEAVHKLSSDKEAIFSLFKEFISSEQKNMNRSFDIIKRNFQGILDNFKKVKESLKRSFVSIKSMISEINRKVMEYQRAINAGMKSLVKNSYEKTNMGNALILFKNSIDNIAKSILSAEKLIIKSDPKTQLKLGYSIAYSDGVIIRRINQIKKGQMVRVQVEDGFFGSEVKIIN